MALDGAASALPRGRRQVRRGLGMAAVLGWSLLVSAVAVLVPPMAGVVGPLYLVGALALAGLWFGRDQERLVEAALWLWVVAPGVRRCVDLASGYHEDSLVLLAAPALSLVCGAAALRPALEGAGALRRLSLRVAVALVYASGVAVVTGIGPPAVAVAAVQVAAPLALGASLFFARRHQDVTSVVQRFATWVPLLVGGYGIAQYIVAPRWDRQWLIDVADVASSFGRPEPLAIRVFSTVNDPGSLAIVLVLCLLLILTSRRPGGLGAAAMAVGATCLGLTLVRSAWLVLALALLFLVLRGWIRLERVTVLLVSLTMTLAVFGSVAQPIVERFESSTSDGTQDQSYQARVDFQSRNFVPALLDPVGAGLGSAGTAARRDGAGDQSFVNTDSGYLELLRTYGGAVGSLLTVSILATCWSASLRRVPWQEGAAAFAVVMPVQLVFSNVLVGVAGVMTWCALALVVDRGRALVRVPQKTDARPRKTVVPR